MDNSELRPQFVDQVVKVRERIFNTVQAKKVNNRAMNGELLVTLIKGYIEIINNGTVPTVESAWFYVCRSEGMKAIQQANRVLEQ